MSKPLGQQVLTDAITLIEDPRLWTQGQFHRSVRLKAPNAGIFTRAQRATARCVDEAIKVASVKYGGEPAATLARNLLYRHMDWKPEPKSIHGWNDDRSRIHGEVLGVMCGALQAA